MTGYLPVVIFLALIVAFAVVSLGAAAVLRPPGPTARKLENYECGAEPIGEAWVQFPVGFYLVALDLHRLRRARRLPLPVGARAPRARALGASATMALFMAHPRRSAGSTRYREGILEWK